jgi:hypothetical protein
MVRESDSVPRVSEIVHQLATDVEALHALIAVSRSAAARTVETVCAAIGDILRAFTPEECANYFSNSGYCARVSGIPCCAGQCVNERRSKSRVIGKFWRALRALLRDFYNMNPVPLHDACLEWSR